MRTAGAEGGAGANVDRKGIVAALPFPKVYSMLTERCLKGLGMAQVFNLFDADGDGKLCREELERLMRNVRQLPLHINLQ
jgi:Ca2+-binding EF-hand superfamily protein